MLFCTTKKTFLEYKAGNLEFSDHTESRSMPLIKTSQFGSEIYKNCIDFRTLSYQENGF